MSIMKDLFIEAYDELYAEAEEAGMPIDDDKLGEMAHEASIDRFAAMCDEAKDRAKYRILEQRARENVLDLLKHLHLMFFRARSHHLPLADEIDDVRKLLNKINQPTGDLC